ncbi:hypothetical protein ACQ4LE_005521 [Meloidogyne hapla]|uniref:Nuclear RNA export factor 1 n=1 Tax=Meloidogyne hapla TaxID=6305 RepID=A0A1I8B433_MELHA
MSRYPGRLDVKARTMKYAVLDPDIASKYEDLDDDEGTSYRAKKSIYRRDNPQLHKKMIGIIEGHIARGQQSNVRSAPSGQARREFIHEITVKNASRAGKYLVLTLLAESVDRFLPIAPRMDANGDLRFSIMSEDDAEAICAMSKRIADKHNPNIKYVIYKKRVPAPFETLGTSTRNVVLEILKTRYNQFTNSLDLSSFQSDPLFQKLNETPRGLIHNSVIVTVADYVSRNLANIKGIRLNNNNLRTLDFVSSLVYAAPNVVELDMANNAISRMEEIAKLSGWQLESVHFENNEFIIGYGDNFAAYTNAIHTHFPLVSYLDGVSVTPMATRPSGYSASQPIPKFKAGYHTDEAMKKMAENFIIEFFGFYDGVDPEQSRQKLINAYDANATFSYSICTLPDTKFVDRGDTEVFNTYVRTSHNIVMQQKWQGFRDRLLFRGPMDIAVALSKLPKTEHVKQSFLLEFNLVSNSLMVITLQGIFRDGKTRVGEPLSSSTECKFFIRQFAIIPKTEGLAILSDILQVTPVSTQRMEHYNNLLKNAAISSINTQLDGMAPPPPSPQQQQLLQPQTLSGMAGTSTSSIGTFIKNEMTEGLQQSQQTNLFNPNDLNARSEMVKQFCLFSGMKADWSEKCLQDCAWSWEDARRAFANIRTQIPPEAFS